MTPDPITVLGVECTCTDVEHTTLDGGVVRASWRGSRASTEVLATESAYRSDQHRWHVIVLLEGPEAGTRSARTHHAYGSTAAEAERRVRRELAADHAAIGQLLGVPDAARAAACAMLAVSAGRDHLRRELDQVEALAEPGRRS